MLDRRAGHTARGAEASHHHVRARERQDLPGQEHQDPREPGARLVLRREGERRHRTDQRDDGDRRDERPDQRGGPCRWLHDPRRTEPRDRGGGHEEARHRADDGGKRGLQHRLDAHPPWSPAPGSKHPRVDPPGTEREDAGGCDDAERDHQGRDEQHVDRSLDGREPLVDDADDPRHRPEQFRHRPVTLEEEQPPTTREDLPELPIGRHPEPEALRHHREGACLVEGDVLADDGRRQREARSGRAELPRERDQLSAIDQDRLGWGCAIGTLDIELLAPGSPIARARLRVQRPVDAIDGDRHGGVAEMQLDLIARAGIQWVRDIVGQPDARTVRSRQDVHMAEHIGTGEEHTAHRPEVGDHAAGPRHRDGVFAHRLLDHGADDRTLAHQLREQFPAPVDQETLAVRARFVEPHVGDGVRGPSAEPRHRRVVDLRGHQGAPGSRQEQRVCRGRDHDQERPEREGGEQRRVSQEGCGSLAPGGVAPRLRARPGSSRRRGRGQSCSFRSLGVLRARTLECTSLPADVSQAVGRTCIANVASGERSAVWSTSR